MKNIIAIVAICLISIGVNAQKITEKDLLGHWDIVSLDISGNYMDFRNDTVSMSTKFLNDNPSMTRDQWEIHFKSTLIVFKTSYVDFAVGKVLTMSLAGNNKQSNYDIIEEGGITSIDDYSGDGPFRVEIKNGLLHWRVDDEEMNVVMVFEKTPE